MLLLLIIALVIATYIVGASRNYKTKAKNLWVEYYLHKDKCKCYMGCEKRPSDYDLGNLKIQSSFWPFYYLGIGIILIWNKFWKSPRDLAELEVETPKKAKKEQERVSQEHKNIIRELEQL